jgi:hypothetical protein
MHSLFTKLRLWQVNEQCKTANEIKLFIQIGWKLFTEFLLEISGCEEVFVLKNPKCA